MTLKNLMDELSGVAVSDYKEIVSYAQELKAKSNIKRKNNSSFVNTLEDWTVSDENWHEVEIW